MAFNNDSGHTRTVANFEKMNAYVNGYGPVYQPSKSSIQQPELQRLLGEARAALRMVQQTESNKKKAQNARTAAFNQMKLLCTRILNMLRASDTSDKTIKDATAIINKIKGIRITKKEEAAIPAETTPEMATSDVTLYIPAEEMLTAPATENGNSTTNAKRTRSSAQTSFDLLIEHFSLLLILLESEMYYIPNEPELQIGTLQMYLETLRMTNSAYIVAEVEWSNARIARDALLR